MPATKCGSWPNLLGAPVLTTVQGKGSIPEDHPLALGSIPVHPAVVDYLASCDVMLAVGTRFTEEDTLEFSIEVPPTMIHVDIDPEEVGRNYAPTLGVSATPATCSGRCCCT